MMLDGSAIIPRGIESVGHCTQAKRQSFFATQTLRDEHGGLGQVERFLSAYANLFPDQLGDQGVRRVFLLSCGHQPKPSCSSCARSRSRHFWRVNPIEPTARPSSAATSVYGREGVSKNKSSTRRRHCGVSIAMASRSICSSCVC